jgi:hypothetical protein
LVAAVMLVVKRSVKTLERKNRKDVRT